MSVPEVALEAAWRGGWPRALGLWSRFTRLGDPIFCFTKKDEKEEGLDQSFAMIRLRDHRVVVSLRQVAERGLSGFPVEVMAHEVGHHVYCPADLTDHARLLARVRRGLPGKERTAGLVANLYADLLINDRLMRQESLGMADVYRTLGGGEADRLWTFYMRVYEILWGLSRQTLATGEVDGPMEGDAQLGARLIRAYAKDWLRGAGRFACLIHPYLGEDEAGIRRILRGWLDTEALGAGGELPDGLAELDADEENGTLHPALDPELSGDELTEEADEEGTGSGRAPEGHVGGRVSRYRQPAEYIEILKGVLGKVSENEAISRYYRELATPHLVRFPVREYVTAKDPLPEGLEPWDVGSPLAEVDWFETASRSPVVVPGLTTVRRTYGDSPGTAPSRETVDLFLGIDCSGSMVNPRLALSYPVLAGAIVTLSALRAGASVWATLSGESPGKYVSTDAWVRDDAALLRILTGYLGTGYTFGIHRLDAAFGPGAPVRGRKSHILIVTDSDIFGMLGAKGKNGGDGWDLARRALERAGGGGTFVLHIPGTWQDARTERLRDEGWALAYVRSWEDIVAFAREFSRRHWEAAQRLAPAPGGGGAP